MRNGLDLSSTAAAEDGEIVRSMCTVIIRLVDRRILCETFYTSPYPLSGRQHIDNNNNKTVVAVDDGYIF